jgi:Rrf2 family protein
MISLSLSNTAEYALRAMTQLALSPDGKALGASELSASTGVPVHYLSKIMRKLVESGLAASSKGHGGGFRLARPAKRISYMDILKVSGYESRASECVFGWGECLDERPCPMHLSWSSLNERFVAWARTTTLDSVAKRSGARKGAKDGKAVKAVKAGKAKA